MKICFIVNPASGKRNAAEIAEQIVRENGIDCEIYRTTAQHDATRYVREYC